MILVKVMRFLIKFRWSVHDDLLKNMDATKLTLTIPKTKQKPDKQKKLIINQMPNKNTS